MLFALFQVTLMLALPWMWFASVQLEVYELSPIKMMDSALLSGVEMTWDSV